MLRVQIIYTIETGSAGSTTLIEQTQTIYRNKPITVRGARRILKNMGILTLVDVDRIEYATVE